MNTDLYPEQISSDSPGGRSKLQSLARTMTAGRMCAALMTGTVIKAVISEAAGRPSGILNSIYLELLIIVLCPLVYWIAKDAHSFKVWRFLPWLLIGILIAATLDGALWCVADPLNNASSFLASLAGTLLMLLPIAGLAADDVLRRRQTEQQLSFYTQHDLLTELPNRSKFQQLLQHTLDHAKLTGRGLAVMYLDIDRFKNINDTFGHGFGDMVLREAARRLRSSLNAKDTISRPSGDEYCLSIEGLSHQAEAEKKAQSIISLLNQPYRIDGHELRITCSIGIALYPSDGEDAVTLIKNADTALHEVKEHSSNNFRFYQAEMNDSVIQRLMMEDWLNKALEHGEFELYYQPQLDLFTGKMNGMEALLRWKHPSVGFISPADFIPLAEDTGLIVPIGEWVLRTACLQSMEWQREGYPVIRTAVNISPIQFHQINFVPMLKSILEESGLAPELLELEITESIAMNHVDQVIDKLKLIRELGVHISIDDFGTGYSSLAYLKKFPITKLKIAQQFVRDVTVDPDDAAIVQAIMGMAHSLKLNVIAEGVETEEQLKFLLDLRCKEIQGYLYSRPVPAAELALLLKQEGVSYTNKLSDARS